MKRFFCVLKQDLRRTILSWVFLAAVLGLTFVNVLSLFDEYPLFSKNTSVLYLEMLMGYRDFYMVFLLFAALPGTTLFCSDWDNRYIRFSVMRSTKNAYATGKVIACFLSAILTVVLAEWLSVLVFSMQFDLYVPSDANKSFGAYQVLITPTATPLYLTATFLCKGFCAGALSVFALWFSTKVTNMFVTLAAPMLVYYLIQVVGYSTKIVPSYLSVDNLTRALVDVGGPLLSLIYTMGVFTTLAVMFGFLFVRSCKRRISNG